MTPPTVEEQAQNPREFYSYRNEVEDLCKLRVEHLLHLCTDKHQLDEVLSSVWEFLCEQERALEREFAARNEEGDE